MSLRWRYSIAGLIFSVFVGLLINIFIAMSIWWWVGLAVLGLLLGYWLGAPKLVSSSPTTHPSLPVPTKISVTRFRALFSYMKIKGGGIHLINILSIASRIDID